MDKIQIEALINFLKTEPTLSPIFWDRINYMMPPSPYSEIYLTIDNFDSDEKQVDNRFYLETRIIAWNSHTNPLDIKDYNKKVIDALRWNNLNIWFQTYQISLMWWWSMLKDNQKRYELVQKFLIRKV